MTMRRDPLLDQEERELASQLARIAPHGQPSAALDARILAMAQRGAGVEAAPGRHHRHRWPAWLAVAASLTAAAGLVWRLEPVLHPAPGVRYEAPASVAADTDPNGQRQPIEYVRQDAAAVVAAPPPPPPVPAAEMVSPEPPPTTASAPVVRARQAAAPVAAAEVAVKPAPAAANAPAAAEPAMSKPNAVESDRSLAQEIPRRPTPASVESSAAVAVSGATAPAAPSPQAARAATAAQDRAMRAKSEDSTILTMPPPQLDRAGFDASPPVTSDTPEVQKAWLAHIRELRDAGKPDEARASLKAFIERDPKASVPDDLKLLLPPAPPAPAPKP